MDSNSRRYDIDALRVIAIGLLLIYHTTIGFQPWGYMIGFITNKDPLSSLWPVMAMLNVWRIPILFFVSGMGVYFALQNRNWKQLISERAKRILIPFVFGIVTIVPLHFFLLQYHYSRDINYTPEVGHLWFLANIFMYVLIMLPCFYYIKKHDQSKIVTLLKRLFSTPLGLMMVIGIFMVELILIQPAIYEMYAMTWHGFFLGLIAFFFGFCFMLAGNAFWNMLLQWKWLLLAMAIILYGNRLMATQMQVHHMLLVLESNFWIFSIFAFTHQYLNKNSTLLSYLSVAAYPIYIIHMVVIYMTSLLVFPLELNAWAKFSILLVSTFLGSVIIYEFFIKRVQLLKPLFGMKTSNRNPPTPKTLKEVHQKRCDETI